MALVIAALVAVLNAVNAAPGFAVAALASAFVTSGPTFGYFADRLPD